MNSMLHLRKSRGAGNEAGYSLVELMIAISIAVFLMAGLFTIFQGTRRTSTDQSGLAELQDEQRLAMTMLTDIVQSAGLYAVKDSSITNELKNDGGNFSKDGQALYGTTADATNGPDTLTVRFENGPTVNQLDCNGKASTVIDVISNTFSLATNAAGVSQLQCLTQSGIPAAAGGTPYPLVNNVTNIQFSYAVNTKNSTAATAFDAVGTSARGVTDNSGCPGDTYIPTGSMQASDWTSVCAVKVVLTFVNPLSAQNGQPATVQFTRVIAILGKAAPAVMNVNPPAAGG